MRDKIHEKETLIKYSRSELADHCITLEHNNKALKATIEQQYANCVQIINDMDVLNERLKNCEVEK